MGTIIYITLIVCLVGNAANSICYSADALSEVNACRKQKGLFAYKHDECLTLAAKCAAKYRAKHRISGHCTNLPLSDFYFIPRKHKQPKVFVYNVSSCAAGCAAWPKNSLNAVNNPGGYSWGSCCTYDTQYNYAGAWEEIGSDGIRYMHLFVMRK